MLSLLFPDEGQTNFGVVGAGLFGKALLLPALQKLPEICLHTLATNSGANVEHSGRKFGFLHQATDAGQIWKNPDIQAVIGLTPHSHHASLVRSALENQKALFLEKPLCTTEEELSELRTLAEQAESLPILMVGHNRRFSPHTEKMQTWLKSRQHPARGADARQFRICSGSRIGCIPKPKAEAVLSVKFLILLICCKV